MFSYRKRIVVSELNLLRYYQRLSAWGVGEPIATALPTIAECLFTTPRHARNLLQQMQALQWLSWQPKAGRHQRSALELYVTLDELKNRLASQQVLKGKYDKALVILDNDDHAFGRLLQRTSGASLREGRLHIQLTYKRSFERLVPHQPHRSSERYLLRQIYSCLVTSDAHGELHPDLAHHWHYDQHSYRWTFYLRPGLTFHDGSPLTAETVVSLFAKLTQLAHYQLELSHLLDVTASQPLRLEFTLAKPDLGFAGLISGVKYCIQPPAQIHTQASVIGCGPFQVFSHDDTKLELRVFERYYACRALTDQVTIWRLPDSQRLPQVETNQPEARNAQSNGCHYFVTTADHKASTPTDMPANIEQSRVEDGCLFVLFNQAASQCLSRAQRRYLSQLLSQTAIHGQLARRNTLFECEIATNLLPQWHAITRPPAEPTELPSALTIAVYDYSALVYCAHAIKELLEQQGFQISIRVYHFRELAERARERTLNEQLIITNINLDDNRHASAYAGLLDNPVLHYALGDQPSEWLTQSLLALRAQTPLTHYLDALEPIASALTTEYWLAPLFHHRQTLRFQNVLKDVALTNWGWPDIKNVWSTD